MFVQSSNHPCLYNHCLTIYVCTIIQPSMFVQSFTSPPPPTPPLMFVQSFTCCRELGSEVNDLIWGKYISSTEVIRRAQELVDKCNRHLPKSADTSKKWVQETFGSIDDLFKNVMALHLAIFPIRERSHLGEI
jgi:hypothetical protein